MQKFKCKAETCSKFISTRSVVYKITLGIKQTVGEDLTGIIEPVPDNVIYQREL